MRTGGLFQFYGDFSADQKAKSAKIYGRSGKRLIWSHWWTVGYNSEHFVLPLLIHKKFPDQLCTASVSHSCTRTAPPPPRIERNSLFQHREPPQALRGTSPTGASPKLLATITSGMRSILITNSNTDVTIHQGRDGSVLSPNPYPTQSTSVNGAHTFPAVFPKAKNVLDLGLAP